MAHGGTGRIGDYFPSNIVDQTDSDLTHVRAAWSIASDCAADYWRAVDRVSDRLLPPHEGLDLIPFDGLLRTAPTDRLTVPTAQGRDYSATATLRAVA